MSTIHENNLSSPSSVYKKEFITNLNLDIMSTIHENNLSSPRQTAVETQKMWLPFTCNGPRVRRITKLFVTDTSVLCLRQITQKKQLQRAPKTLDSVDAYFLCLDCSKIVKLLNKLVGT